jgi:putative methionine-R-sulfoxide reductase with GAF domain
MHLIVLLVFVVNSCASIPDTIICAEVSLSKGVCTLTVSGKNIIIDDEHPFENETWWDIRSKSLIVPAKSWAKIKAFLIKQCRKTNQCDADISSWDRDLAL